jgi:hypothetical protein
MDTVDSLRLLYVKAPRKKRVDIAMQAVSLGWNPNLRLCCATHVCSFCHPECLTKKKVTK